MTLPVRPQLGWPARRQPDGGWCRARACGRCHSTARYISATRRHSPYRSRQWTPNTRVPTSRSWQARNARELLRGADTIGAGSRVGGSRQHRRRPPCAARAARRAGDCRPNFDQQLAQLQSTLQNFEDLPAVRGTRGDAGSSRAAVAAPPMANSTTWSMRSPVSSSTPMRAPSRPRGRRTSMNDTARTGADRLLRPSTLLLALTC